MSGNNHKICLARITLYCRVLYLGVNINDSINHPVLLNGLLPSHSDEIVRIAGIFVSEGVKKVGGGRESL